MIKSLTTIFLTLLILLAPAYSQSGGTGSPATGPGTARKAFRPTKAQITEAQELLKSNGSYTGPVDGKYNDEFRDALKGYQQANDLDAGGKLDEATLKAMGILLTDAQMGIAPAKGRGTGRRAFRVNKEQITQAQAILAKESGYTGPKNGKYDKDLRASIRDYQSANGLKRTGSLNKATLQKMGIGLTEAQEAFPSNPDDLASESGSRATGRRIFRASKQQITEVQKMLTAKGLYGGSASGKLDDATRESIKKWQENNGIKVTGTLNKETLEAMGIELTESQRSG